MNDLTTRQTRPTLDEMLAMIRLFDLEDAILIAASATSHCEDLEAQRRRAAADQIRKLARESGLSVNIEKRPRKRGRLSTK